MFFKKLTTYEPAKRFTISQDDFHGSYYKPETDHFPGKVMVIFGGSVGSFTLTEMAAEKFYEAGMDCLLPSELICQKVYQRLTKNQFTYPFEHYNYEIASHYLLPIKPMTAKMFRVERKQPAECAQSRADAWKDTLRFLEEKW